MIYRVRRLLKMDGVSHRAGTYISVDSNDKNYRIRVRRGWLMLARDQEGVKRIMKKLNKSIITKTELQEGAAAQYRATVKALDAKKRIMTAIEDEKTKEKTKSKGKSHAKKTK